MSRRLRPPTLRRMREDSGAVALMTALLMVVFMGMAAIAVDLAREYALAAQLQKAADAGALAGAVYLPDRLDLATQAAKDVVAANYKNNSVGTLVPTVSVGSRPTQLIVTVSASMSFTFGAAIGIGSTTVTRSAKADFAGPTPMGSPCNIFGQDVPGQGSVASANCAVAGTYWTNIAGANVNKARGDAYSSGWCTAADAGTIDGCSPASTSASNPGVNSELDPSGYTYIVRVLKAGTLTLEGYDIAWVATGDTCTDNLAGAAGVTNDYVTTSADSTKRYAATGGTYCPGDTQMGWSNGDLSPVKTSVIVRSPATISTNPLDGPVIAGCSRSWDGWGDKYTSAASVSNQNPALATGGDLVLASKLDKTKATYDKPLAEVFHRWAPLCQSQALTTNNSGDSFAVTPGDYSIQVKTTGGGGQNRFGLRAILNAGADNGEVSIFAAGKASFFNNVTAGTSEFFLARLSTATAGKNMTLSFFDLGDATAPVTVTVLQPDSSTLTAGSAFTGCVGKGPFSGSLSGCSVTTTSATNGGKWQYITFPIPSNYKCNSELDQSKCWIKIRTTTSSGQSDTTTWGVSLDGDPLRLTG